MTLDGYSALHVSAQRGSKQIVDAFIDNGKLEYETINRITNVDAPTLLLIAVSNEWTRVVERIVDKISVVHVSGWG